MYSLPALHFPNLDSPTFRMESGFSKQALYLFLPNSKILFQLQLISAQAILIQVVDPVQVIIGSTTRLQSNPLALL